jgi:hypothetical protein
LSSYNPSARHSLAATCHILNMVFQHISWPALPTMMR